MNDVRRTLLKGLLAGTAAGLPGWSLAAPRIGLQPGPQILPPPVSKPIALLLTGTAVDALFLAGARTAAAESGGALRVLAAARRGGIIDPAASGELFAAHRGLRIVGLADDASYVLLAEIARDAGVGLLAEGRHGQFAQAVSRHELRVASGLHGAAETLAAGLARGDGGFAVAEQAVGPSSAWPGRDWSAHGFASYRIGAVRPLCLHLAGLPLAGACRALDLGDAAAEAVVRVIGRPREVPVDGAWPALLGYALTSAGSASGGSPAADQVFLRGAAVLGQPQKLASLVSFVIDL